MLVILVMFTTMSIVISQYDAQRDPLDVGNYALYPAIDAGAPRTVDPAHYDDLRDVARDRAEPYIQSQVVRGPFLRLLVPYRPESDTAALQRDCPELAKLHGDARRDAFLACLQRLHRITLDGRPRDDVQYDLSSDARTNRPALLAMIDLRALPPGRHELLVARPPQSKTPAAYRIPFWH
jgi:hypothetical protein